jgi:TorA maturation chaperone TorD
MAVDAAPRQGSREHGLDCAIAAVGGVGELARRLGLSQPSVSGWRRIPAERVSAVAEATGLPRTTLRPDLYPDAPEPDEIDAARAREYALLARLVLQAPDAALLRALAGLRGDGTPLGLARISLAQAAAGADPTSLSQEFFAVFIGVGRGEVLPYASFYRTGFLHERPLAEVRAALAELGLERQENVAEPEDHLGTLCEVMAQLATEADAGQNFFARHLEPWAGRAFADIEAAPSAGFYRAAGAYGRAFIEIETEAFALPG